MVYFDDPGALGIFEMTVARFSSILYLIVFYF